LLRLIKINSGIDLALLLKLLMTNARTTTVS
jgi:hypothetical protein